MKIQNIDDISFLYRHDDFHCFFGRTWLPRRVACTSEKVVFSHVDSDILLDIIPLAEIISIQKKENQDQKDTEKHETDEKVGNNVDFTNSFHISTQKGGYNAGRAYFLRAREGSDITLLVNEISLGAKGAKQRAASTSFWIGIQFKISAVYNSNLFQGFAAFLIIAVRLNALLHFVITFITSKQLAAGLCFSHLRSFCAAHAQ